MLFLAYGEFHLDTHWGIFCDVMPFLFNQFVPALFLYAFCSIVTEQARVRTLGVCLFVLAFAVLIAPNLAVMGAYGPAHVGMEFGFLVWPSLLLVLIAKTVIRMCTQPVLKRPRRDGLPACLHCGYLLVGVRSPRCPECGAGADAGVGG